MITEINRHQLDRSLILPNRIRGRPILLLIPSISMKFRQSTRHTELIRCPTVYLSFSPSSAHIIAPESSDYIFPRSFVLLSIFLSPWTSVRILTSLSNIKSQRFHFPVGSPLENVALSAIHLARRTRYLHDTTFPRQLLARDSRSRECRARAGRKKRIFLRARERASVCSHLGVARAGGAQTFH